MNDLESNSEANHACPDNRARSESPSQQSGAGRIGGTSEDFGGLTTTKNHPKTESQKLNVRPAEARIPAWAVHAAVALQANREDVPSGCSEWRSFITKSGYPQVKLFGKQHPAHRLAAILFYGPGAVHGKDVHHLCEVSSCVNPRHLVPVTATEHALIHRGLLTIGPPPENEASFTMDEIYAALSTASPRRAPKAVRQ